MKKSRSWRLTRGRRSAGRVTQSFVGCVVFVFGILFYHGTPRVQSRWSWGSRETMEMVTSRAARSPAPGRNNPRQDGWMGQDG